MRDALRRVLLPRLGGNAADEMDDEIAAHIQLHVDALIRAGVSPHEARRAAAERFRGLRAARPALHRTARQRSAQLRRRGLTQALSADVRSGWRQMRRNLLQTALAVIALGSGIGMTTAMFTLVEHVLLQPLPLPNSDRLVMIRGQDSLRHKVSLVSNDDWLDWKAGTRSFSSMALFTNPARATLQLGDSALRVTERSASADFFSTLGTRFIAGRSFTPREVQSQARVVVVSEKFWRSHLGADPTLSRGLGTGAAQVVGVIAANASIAGDADVWNPIRVVSYGGGATRDNINATAIARLRPAITLAQASADLTRVAHDIRARDGGGLYDVAADVVPLRTMVIGDATTPLRLLTLGVVMVLLIVCVNLAISTLARGQVRSGEMAIRLSLGAGRARLIRQLLVEQLVLAGFGCLLGLGLAWLAVHGVVAGWGDSIPRAGEVRMDGGVLAFGVGISLAAGLMSGVVPALLGSRVPLQAALNAAGPRSIAGRLRCGAVLVVLEIALALSLMAGAGLLIRSFDRLTGRALGFSRNLAMADVFMPGDSSNRTAQWTRLMDAYASVPGVRQVGAANDAPMSSGGIGFIGIEGRPETGQGAGYRVVTEGYFGALGVRVLRGRSFGPQDVAGSERTTVISETMARQYWGNADPIGQHVRAISMEGGFNPAAAGWLTIVGVVSDVRQYGYEIAPQPEMYVSFRQTPGGSPSEMTIVASASVPAERLLAALRTRTHELAPHLGVDLTTVDDKLADEVAPLRLTAGLLTGFALVALLLAALGIYAVLSGLVSSRTREIAVRLAVGAQRTDVLALVVAQGMRVAIIGTAIGVLASMALSRVLVAMLVDVSAVDPIAFSGAAGLLLTVACIAAAILAWRASRLDPMLVLKQT